MMHGNSNIKLFKSLLGSWFR